MKKEAGGRAAAACWSLVLGCRDAWSRLGAATILEKYFPLVDKHKGPLGSSGVQQPPHSPNGRCATLDTGWGA